MYLSQKEKKRHPEYEQYIALFEETITQMESGARGRGAPEAIIERCLDKALEFYDADSAALVETNLDLGYGVCVSEHCKTGIRSFEGRIIGVTPEETPHLYEKVMALEVFDVHVQEERGQLSNNEYSMLTRMGVEVFAVAPYLKRYSGYVYIRNPRRFVGLYGFLQAVSYVCASERNEYKLMDNLNVAVSSKECRSEQEVRIKVFGGLSITTKAYHCTGTGNQFRAPHNGFTINAVILEDAVLQQINLQIQRAIDIESFLKRMSMQDVAKQLKMQRQAKIGVLKAKAADLKKRRSKAFEDLSDAMIDKEVYRAQMDKLSVKLDTVTKEIAVAEKRRDEVDLYFSIDNKWLRTFVETGAQNEMTPELIHQLIQRIDVYSDKRIQITFNYANCMNPLLECVEEAKRP